MATERSDSKASSPSGNQTIWERLGNASGSSSSSPPVRSASPTPFTFGGRSPSPSFAFKPKSPPQDTNNTASTLRSGVNRFTKSPTPSGPTTAQTGASPPRDNDDPHPDSPIPSVESVSSSVDSDRSSPSTISDIASSTGPAPVPRAPSTGTTQDQADMLRNLRLESTPPVRSMRSSSTPLIQITASASENDSTQARAARSDSLVGGVSALRLASVRESTPDNARLREERSVTPSRRRRSGSGIIKTIHQVEDEEPPEALRHVPEAQTALTKAKALTSKMVTVLSSSSMHLDSESSIAKLHRQAVKLSTFELPSSRIVGLVGDSGVGKSSLINSLLDQIDLARASGNGTACTCAVTEYIFHDRDDFIIEVEYFPIEELRKQFEELLDAYRDYHLHSKASGNRSSSERDDAREAKRKELKAKLAAETFKASFGDRLASTPTLLTFTPLEQAVRTMVEWALDLIPNHTTRDAFNTREACAARLRDLTSESIQNQAASQPSTFWPFIRKLRVYLKAFILKKGLIIADLPGLRDLNSTRKAITERHIRQCHQIFVVARIDRAVTDASIKEVFELAGRANLSKVDVICTRSEDIQVREAKDDWPEERARIEELQQEIKDTAEELTTLKDDIDEFGDGHADLTREEQTELLKLQLDCSKAQKSKDNLEFELSKFIITTRNNTVSNLLRDKYGKARSGSTSRMFCVSNSMYWAKRNDPATTALPYLKLSGILELRRYCIGIVAQSRLRATREFIKDEVPAFLGTAQLWIEAGSGSGNAERKQKTLDTVAAIENVMNMLVMEESKLNNASQALALIFRTCISPRMTQNAAKWTMNSRRASQAWNGYHHSSYKAFCSNYGDHYTKTVGSRCWNQEAMSGIKADMSPAWNTLVSSVAEYHREMENVVEESFGKMLRFVASSQLFESGATSNTAMRALTKVLRHREGLVLHGLERANESFDAELSALYTDTFSEVRTAFFGTLVENAYHVANMECGSGSDQRRKRLITSTFGSDDLFKKHERECRVQFAWVIKEYQENVDNIIAEQIEQLQVSLEMLKNENVILESEKNPEFRKKLENTLSKVNEDLETLGRLVEDVS